LEKVVRETNGKVKLAKVDIDQNQEIAALLRVQSVPTVYAFLRSQPVDGFMGVQPESQIKDFVDRLLKAAGVQQNNTDAETMTMAQGALDTGDAKNAILMFQKVLEDDPGNLSALNGLIRAHILDGNISEAQQIFNKLPKDVSEHKDLAQAGAALELRGETADLAPLNDLETKVQKNPKDLAARFDYALALLGQNQPEPAINELLESIKQNRSWEEEKARTQLVKVFEMLGHEHPLTVSGRKRLSSILFS
jgi:putative thioredoxin